MALSGKVKPVAIAHELGVKPQQIYSWIKSGKLRTFNGTGNVKQLVDATEVRGLVNKSVQKGPRSTKPRTIKTKSPSTGKWQDAGYPSPLEHADIVSYGNKSGKVVGQVRKQDEYFTTFASVDPAADPAVREREMEFQNTKIAELLAKGNFRLEPLDDILNFVLYQLVHEADPHEVRAFLEYMVEYKHRIDVELNPALVEDIDHLDDTSEEPVEDAPWIKDQVAAGLIKV
jgi:hypothetical protein